MSFQLSFKGISHDAIVQESKKYWQNMEASAHGSQVSSFCLETSAVATWIFFFFFLSVYNVVYFRNCLLLPKQTFSVAFLTPLTLKMPAFLQHSSFFALLILE